MVISNGVICVTESHGTQSSGLWDQQTTHATVATGHFIRTMTVLMSTDVSYDTLRQKITFFLNKPTQKELNKPDGSFKKTGFIFSELHFIVSRWSCSL